MTLSASSAGVVDAEGSEESWSEQGWSSPRAEGRPESDPTVRLDRSDSVANPRRVRL